MRAYAQGSGAGGGKRISQSDFTEKAWEAIISAPEVARGYSQQVQCLVGFARVGGRGVFPCVLVRVVADRDFSLEGELQPMGPAALAAAIANWTRHAPTRSPIPPRTCSPNHP